MSQNDRSQRPARGNVRRYLSSFVTDTISACLMMTNCRARHDVRRSCRRQNSSHAFSAPGQNIDPSQIKTPPCEPRIEVLQGRQRRLEEREIEVYVSPIALGQRSEDLRDPDCADLHLGEVREVAAPLFGDVSDLATGKKASMRVAPSLPRTGMRSCSTEAHGTRKAVDQIEIRPLKRWFALRPAWQSSSAPSRRGRRRIGARARHRQRGEKVMDRRGASGKRWNR